MALEETRMRLTPAILLPRPVVVAGLLGLGALFIALAFGLAAHPARAAVPTKGDVYAAIGNGRVAHYTNTGTLVETLNSTTGSLEGGGMCFDASANLFSTQFQSNTMSKFSPGGSLIAAQFGSSYNQHPESCVVNAAGQILVGQADGTHQVRKLDASGTLITTYSPAVQSRGTDWIDLAADQCTVYYTSEGSLVKRFNVCTNTQLADFATAPSIDCFAHRLRPNGELMLACSNAVYRFGSGGALIHTYLAASLNPRATALFALNLDPDGTTFWTADHDSHQVYRVDITSGSQVVSSTFIAASTSTVAGLAVAGEIVVSQPSPSPTPTVPTPTPSSPLPAPPATGRQ
jgi:hypothetical protein